MAYSEYMLKVNLAIMAGWLLYRLAFRRLTFFQWNRFYLLGFVVLSFLLPFCRLPRGSRLAAVADLNGIGWEYMDFLLQSPAPLVPEAAGISSRSLSLDIYLAGIFLFMVLFVWRFLKNWKLTRHAEKVKGEGIKIFVLDGKTGSFTFLRGVYLDKHTWAKQEGHVLRHEMVHASQLHFLDLIFMTFVGVILWFNPFVFLLLRSVRENHEYLADDQSLRGPGTLASYLACLRDETILRNSPTVASYFKSSTIKKRIIMLTNSHTKRHKKWLYLAVIPLAALMLLVFQSSDLEQVANAPAKALEVIPGVSENSSPGEIPSLFPLPEEFRDNVTWGYNKTMIHPITKKKLTHKGVDFRAPAGTSVFAASGGVVKTAESLEGWGNLVIIEHSETYTSHYSHLDGFKVKKGDKVTKGQIVATVGSTGRSTGPHLHYEVRIEGTHVNPADYY